MNEQELNKKLAEWAGFKETAYYESGSLAGHHQYSHPNGTVCIDIQLPKFTQSLDACFKWLVPKVHRVEIIQEFNSQAYARITVQPEYKYVDYQEWAETQALALCLAIEKLVDGGK